MSNRQMGGTMKTELEQYGNPAYFKNRELSWIQFNERVLSEARDRSILLFERLKFASITSSNLDEFYMVRVASLKDQENSGYNKPDFSGLTPKDQLEAISRETHHVVEMQYNTFNRSLLPALENISLRLITDVNKLTAEEREYINRYFDEQVYPVLTPMAIDQSRPFPLIRNKTLNIGAMIYKKGGKKKKAGFATVQVPSVLSRFLELPVREDGSRVLVLLEDIIIQNITKLYMGYEVLCAHPYRIMRNAELGIEEDEAADLLIEIEKSLKRRQWGEVIRLEVDDEVDERLLTVLKEEFSISDKDIFMIPGPIDLTFLMNVYDLDGFDAYKITPYQPCPVKRLQNEKNIFENIQEGDIFLHHPYMSFDPVIKFVRQAADDPNVLAIKQTLYRVSGNSPIMAALEAAALNGKQVTVLVELKARFDEENNIVWAKELEKAGCHVIYGLVGLKTHSKITLIVRREEDEIRRYVHLGTGNYNDKTAKLYTDCGILTCDPRIGADASAVFNMISGYSEPASWNSLFVAPYWLRKRFLFMIQNEEKNARDGKKARIVAKMNSLCDKEIIEALYRASSAGVQIDLIIRGICSLRTGIPGISENIHVRSIVGNFLEHARIFYFYNNGVEDVYMGSADWMPRNLDKRVEIVFPLYDEKTRKEAIHILKVQLADTVKARILQDDGTYARVDRRGKAPINAQEQFCEELQENIEKKGNLSGRHFFIPAEAPEE
jgi:polyphosphate kinase